MATNERRVDKLKGTMTEPSTVTALYPPTIPTQPDDTYFWRRPGRLGSCEPSW